MAIDPFAPLSLKRWIRGKVRIHFTGGHVAEVEVDQATADRLGRKVAGQEGPDEIGAPGVRWLQIYAEKVNLLEWTPAADFGWGPPSPEDRDVLADNGHPRGILKSLADLWEDSDCEPAYCLQAIRQLHFAASTDVPADVWARLARFLEGESGVRVLKEADASHRPEPSSDGSNQGGGNSADDADLREAKDASSQPVEDQPSTNSSASDDDPPQPCVSPEPTNEPEDT